MELHVGHVNEWNNRILVAPEQSKVGQVQHINVTEEHKKRKKGYERIKKGYERTGA